MKKILSLITYTERPLLVQSRHSKILLYHRKLLGHSKTNNHHIKAILYNNWYGFEFYS